MKRTVPTIQALVFCDVLQLSESVLSRAREQRRLLGRTWRRERQREGVNAASRVLSRCSELVLGYEHQSIFMAPESAPCAFFIARTQVYTKAKAISALLPGALG